MLTQTAVGLFAALFTASVAAAQSLVPMQPVQNNIEAIGAGDFGESIVKLATGLSSQVTGTPGILRLQFYDRNGMTLGNEAWVRPEEYRTISFTCDSTAFGSATYRAIAPSDAIEIKVADYILDAGPTAYCFEIRLYQFGVMIASTTPDPDGLPGGNGTDAFDKRFEIIRNRGQLTSARIEYDPQSSTAILRLTTSLPPAGPAVNQPTSLRNPIPQGLADCFLSNPNDTDPFHLPPDCFEVYGTQTSSTWRSLTSADIGSISILPGSTEIVITFDRKFSVLAFGLSPQLLSQFRVSANARIHDAWGQRVRGNAVPFTSVACPGLPNDFNLYSPSHQQIDLAPYPVSLRWETPGCATAGYSLDVSTDPQFSTFTWQTFLSTFQTHLGYAEAIPPQGVLQPGTKYYWRVFAINANGQTGALQNGSWFATRLPGDNNGDGSVDAADLSVLLANFGASLP